MCVIFAILIYMLYLLNLQRTELELRDGKIIEYVAANGPFINFNVRNVGLYLVIESDIGLTVLWDRKTTVRIILQPKHMVSQKVKRIILTHIILITA